MKVFWVIVLLLLSSCNSSTSPKEEVITEKAPKLKITHSLSQIELQGIASASSQEWKAYQDFITGLENLDHTIASAEQLSTHIEDMKTSIPEKFNDQGLLSRLKVLETRVKSYHSILTHSEIDIATQQHRFNLLITALDQFKIQMMDVLKAQQQKESLLKNLEENELKLDQSNKNISEQ